MTPADFLKFQANEGHTSNTCLLLPSTQSWMKESTPILFQMKSIVKNIKINQCRKGEWLRLIKNDIKYLGIGLSFDKIKSYSKNSFSNFLKNHICNEAFKNLLNEKERQSKLSQCSFKSFRLANYLGAG